MRERIENPVYMSFDEIEKKYLGYWVLVTKCNFTEHNRLLGGVPVVIADAPFKGQRDGFFDEYKKPEYSPKIGKNLDYDSLLKLKFFFDSDESEKVEESAGDDA